MNSRRGYALVLFLCALACTAFLYAKYNPNQYRKDALRISSECESSAKNRSKCLDMELMKYTDSNPAAAGAVLSGFWQLEQQGTLHDDPRIFSDTAHMVGMDLIQKKIPLGTAISYCSTDFKQACIHGTIMEYTDNTYKSKVDPKTLFTLCDDISGKSTLIRDNCFHAVGHELQAKNYTTINATLDQCPTVSTSIAYACQTGVFMEYSKGNMGSGSHSEMPSGTTRLPCSKVNTIYKTACYTSEGSYRQYTPGQETFAQSYAFCSTVESDYSKDCTDGVLDQLLFSKAGDFSKALIVCQSLAPMSIQGDCAASVRRFHSI